VTENSGTFLAGWIHRSRVLEPAVPHPAVITTRILTGPLPRIAAWLTAEAAASGVAAGRLARPLPIDDFIELGRLLGDPYEERAAEVQPFVSKRYVLNLTARSPAAAPTALQPFSQAPLTLHTESSGAPLDRQPRYICLMCQDPGDPDVAQTVAVPMEQVAAALAGKTRAILRATRYDGPDCPTILRGPDERPIFAFRDFGSDPLDWRAGNASSEEVNAALNELTSSLYAAPVAAVRWERALIVLIDNQRVFHGRTAGRGLGAGRHLQRLRLLARS